MGTWGAGNFESDSALDYMGDVADELKTRIEEILADEERRDLDEDGEGMLMPSVAMLSVLHEYCRAPTPKRVDVERWKDAYLAVFDENIEYLEPSEGYEDERRKVIVKTFDKLIAQSAAFYRDGVETPSSDEEDDDEEDDED